MEFEPDLAARVAPLIRKLDDDDVEQRLAASASLLEIGPIAIALLRTELQKPLSLEARRRIESVLDRVDGTVLLDLRTPKKEGK
jgi:HEAT repeat protein